MVAMKKALMQFLYALCIATVATGFMPNTPFQSARLIQASINHCAPPSSTRIFQMQNAVQQEEDRYLELAMQSEGVMARPDVVYVIMYNPGTEQEGIHTMEFPRGEETDLLLAFESIENCVNFSNMLRQDPNWQQEPIPTPTPLDQVEMACQQMGLPLKVVPNQLG
jgi:hypothetical protein